MLIYRALYNFSKSKTSVLMIKDFPPLGFEGQVVSVKPGYAISYLIPNQYAIYDFPGVKNRIFPDLKEEDLLQRQEIYKESTNFIKKLGKTQFRTLACSILYQSTFSQRSCNQQILDQLKEKEIVNEMLLKYNMNLKLENVQILADLNKFGNFKVEVRNYYNETLNKKYDFNINVSVKKQVIEKKIEKKVDNKENPKK